MIYQLQVDENYGSGKVQALISEYYYFMAKSFFLFSFHSNARNKFDGVSEREITNQPNRRNGRNRTSRFLPIPAHLVSNME